MPPEPEDPGKPLLLISLLQDPGTMEKAAEALGELKDPRAIQPLVDCLKGFTHNKRAPMDALVKIGAAAVPDLIGVVEDEDVFSKGPAMEVLGDIGDTRAVLPLLSALKNGIPDFKAHAAKALGKLGSPRAVLPLMDTLQVEQSGMLRPNTVDALGKLRDRRATRALIRMIDDPHPLVPAKAVDALRKLQDLRSVDDLLKILESEEPRHKRLRPAVCKALVEINDPVMVRDFVHAYKKTGGDKVISEALQDILENCSTLSEVHLFKRDLETGIRRLRGTGIGLQGLEKLMAAAESKISRMRSSLRDVKSAGTLKGPGTAAKKKLIR